MVVATEGKSVPLPQDILHIPARCFRSSPDLLRTQENLHRNDPRVLHLIRCSSYSCHFLLQDFFSGAEVTTFPAFSIFSLSLLVWPLEAPICGSPTYRKEIHQTPVWYSFVYPATFHPEIPDNNSWYFL